MDRYSKLIRAIEAAVAPSRALDREILRYVSGRVMRDETFINGPKDGTREIERAYPFKLACWFAPRYTESLAAAVSLVPSSCTFALGDCNQDDESWACLTDRSAIDYAATATTPELALCLASIKAHEASVER